MIAGVSRSDDCGALYDGFLGGSKGITQGPTRNVLLRGAPPFGSSVLEGDVLCSFYFDVIACGGRSGRSGTDAP